MLAVVSTEACEANAKASMNLVRPEERGAGAAVLTLTGVGLAIRNIATVAAPALLTLAFQFAPGAARSILEKEEHEH